MSAAPPVRIHLVPDPLGRGFALVCTSLAAANLTPWCLSWAGASADLSAVTVTLATAAATVAAAFCWRLLARRVNEAGALTWDGSVWQWAPEAENPWQGQVQVMIDLGPWLLLRFRATAPARRECWLAISRRTSAGQWPAWRAALYAVGEDTRLRAAIGPT